jgi:hypothetical protein
MENSPQLLLEQQPLADRTQRIEFQVRVYAAIMNPKTIWRQNSFLLRGPLYFLSRSLTGLSPFIL